MTKMGDNGNGNIQAAAVPCVQRPAPIGGVINRDHLVGLLDGSITYDVYISNYKQKVEDYRPGHLDHSIIPQQPIGTRINSPMIVHLGIQSANNGFDLVESSRDHIRDRIIAIRGVLTTRFHSRKLLRWTNAINFMIMSYFVVLCLYGCFDRFSSRTYSCLNIVSLGLVFVLWVISKMDERARVPIGTTRLGMFTFNDKINEDLGYCLGRIRLNDLSPLDDKTLKIYLHMLVCFYLTSTPV
jgi:hypothetical protein